jgi:hypothetical protein
MPYLPWFPEPGSYVKYYDVKAKAYKYLRLMWRRVPFNYPKRLPAVAAATKGNSFTFDELNPSDTKQHRYLLYLGVKPGFRFYLYHPFDIKVNKWDENITEINEDLVACITYEESPYDKPTKAIAVEHDRYPALVPMNISGSSAVPEVNWMGALYVVKEQTQLTPDELVGLEQGRIRSYPWDFGGEL